MTNEELKRACVRAGGKYSKPFNEWRFKVDSAVPRKIPDEWLDVLMPYVADVLVGMVRAKQIGRMWQEYERRLLEQHESWPLLATPEQRITAAMEVLSDD